jgi:hypothetical protein
MREDDRDHLGWFCRPLARLLPFEQCAVRMRRGEGTVYCNNHHSLPDATRAKYIERSDCLAQAAENPFCLCTAPQYERAGS